MKKSSTLYIIFETVTTLFLILIMILVYYHVKNHIRKDYLKSRAYQINRTSELLDTFIQRKKSVFEKFSTISGKREAASLLNDFADVYTLDSRLKVRQVFLKDPDSGLTSGYDYSNSPAAEFFKGVDSQGVRLSSMYKSGENSNISLYFAVRQGDTILAGRVPIARLSLDFAIFAGYRDDIILFASGEGEVLASSNERLRVSVLPDETVKTVTIGREYFITRKFNRSIDGVIALLTPVSAVYKALDATGRYVLYFIMVLIAFISLRFLFMIIVIFRPLEKFIDMISRWRIDSHTEIQHSLIFRIKEFDTLYNAFFEKTREIRNSISELKENETDLENMRQYLKSIIDSMPSIVIVVDMNARITEWNRAAEKFTGISAENALGHAIWHKIPELGRYSDAFYEALSRDELREFKKQVFTKKNKVYMDITIFPVTGLESVAAAIRIDDITPFEEAEKKLRQALKMEIVTTISTGLAHDFNNVLGGILGAASIMKKKITGRTVPDEQNDNIARYLDIIESSACRATGIITRLLALSMKQEVEFRVTDLNAIAVNVEKICRNSFDKSIQIDTLLPGSPSPVNADQYQIEQVMLTLCINAAHSMTIMRPEGQKPGGRLIIKITENISGAELSSVYVEANPGVHYRSFSVIDDGVGIDNSRLIKIFEPFFTTKTSMSGTGLGLAMSYNIIRLHGGFITVDSQPGRGSEFTVFLPAVNAEIPGLEMKAEHSAYSGEGTVLVIDDEPVIRELASVILSDCGYSVITASDGSEAVTLFREKSGSIKLVLLDLSMPGMSGIETFAELQKIDPHVTVLMSSGFVYDERIGKAASSGAAGFIHKPYTMDKLSETVHRILSTKNHA